MLTGIDILQREKFSVLQGKRVGLLSNAGTIDRNYRYVLDVFRQAHGEGVLKLEAIFGPQHGLWGHTQDNMIEWEGSGRTYSLYGAHREPTEEMLEGLEVMVVDIPDVGARYYTFIWSLALVMKACERLGMPVLVLDRPNPIGGEQVEGTLLDPDFSSFVGLYPLPTRHGMTAGEIAHYLRAEFFQECELEVIRCEGWDRTLYLDETGYPWAMPSPNMPTVDTAVVYPGMCLLEATNLSEGRGTTRPFEVFGAPWLDGWELASQLNGIGLPGVTFRPLEFQPTFQKHAGAVCGGCFMHVTDRRVFQPVLTAVSLLQATHSHKQNEEGHARWNDPPYEYEYVKLPIDILAGNNWLRTAIEYSWPLSQIVQRMGSECESFSNFRQEHRLY